MGSEQLGDADAMTFDALLARADEETLRDLVGADATRLLNLLDPRLGRPSVLRAVCAGLHSPAELLRNQARRTALVQLLPQPVAEKLATAMALDGDPYSALAGAQIRKNSAAERLFFDRLGVEVELDEHLDVEAPITQAAVGRGLFPHQRAAARRVRESLDVDPNRVILHMPTGAGKTRTAMDIVASELRRREPTLVVWLAYSEELCAQAADEFVAAWQSVGDHTLDVYRYWGDRDLDIADIRDGLLVASLGKTYQRARRDIDFLSRLSDRASLVVIDEAHQAIAETYRFVLEYLIERRRGLRLLGLTATPGRTWNDPAADRKLADFFGRQKVTLEVDGYENPVEYLVDSGYLARANFRTLPYDAKAALTPRQLEQLAAALDVPDSVLAHLAADEQRNLLIVSAIEDMARRHERIIVFAASVHHATLLATVLRAREWEAAAVTGVTPRFDRERIIRRFRAERSGVQILCNYGVLTTGFDAPKTSAALVARPTRSLVLYSQMIGRALRGPRAGGNAAAEIATVVDTALPGFGDPSEAFMNWEDVWE